MDTTQKLVKDIRERIKKIRVDKGYSQDYMAEMLDISQNSYHKLEKGHTRIHLQKFITISRILEVNASELINGPNHKYIFSNYYENDIDIKLE